MHRGIEAAQRLVLMASGGWWPRTEMDWQAVGRFYHISIEYEPLPPWLAGVNEPGRIVVRDTPDRDLRLAVLRHELVERIVKDRIPALASAAHRIARTIDQRIGRLCEEEQEMPIVYLPLLGAVE